ncbi:hypothetical protein SDC9_07939 [bioreactor metagenome]|uniref:HTH deoR-type domain-containing protein n=1 Tax=bioreactor metagenome TaxID=1076179 RepID=A0A644T5W9_9ZZZZ|nr:hypothetical protein [Candidatus Elulimicrobiales bacterium]
MNTVPPNYNLLIAKKTEKIVTAIYLISQFLKDTESLKHELRKESNNLLRALSLLAYGDHKDVFPIYKGSLDSVSLLISYLTIAKESNLISRMNVEIVIEALRVLENLLVKKQFNLRRENLFINEENFLISLLDTKDEVSINTNTSYDVLTGRNIVEENFSNQTKTENNKNISIKDKISKGQNLNIKDKTIEKEADKTKTVIKDTFKPSSIKPEPKAKKSAQNKERKNNRREQILALFSKGVEVSIKDISKKIVGCSVKTIQRELNDLVSENKIERIGDKRWSKYTLVK